MQGVGTATAETSQARRDVDGLAGLAGPASGDGLEEHVVEIALRHGWVAFPLKPGVELVLLAVQQAQPIDDPDVQHRAGKTPSAPIGR